MAIEDQDGHSVTVERHFNCAVEALFDAFIDPKMARLWMYGPDTHVEEFVMEPRVGGRFYLLMRGKDRDWPHEGQVTVYDRPNALAFTWLSPSTHGATTLVEIAFTRVSEDRSALTLTHRYLGERYPEFEAGWTHLFDQLAAL